MNNIDALLKDYVKREILIEYEQQCLDDALYNGDLSEEDYEKINKYLKKLANNLGIKKC